MSEFGIERARELAAESHRMARAALAEAAVQAPVHAGAPAAAEPDAHSTHAHPTLELEQIADFIYTRTS